jgi:hypothetical protein
MTRLVILGAVAVYLLGLAMALGILVAFALRRANRRDRPVEPDEPDEAPP